MNKRMEVVSDPKTGREPEACNRYGLGRNRMREVAETCGAVIHIGNCRLYNYTKIDAYMDSKSGNRRYLIIRTGASVPTKSIFKPESMNDIRAAWGQAVAIYKAENPPLILPESCLEQAERM